MKLHVISVGRLREAYFKAACDEYASRIRHYLPLEELEVPSATGDIGNGSGHGALRVEGESILRQVPKSSKLIAMDVRGERFTSEQVSQLLQAEMSASTQHLVFAIGGAWGLSPQLLETANLRLSLSSMTFPHELARLVLLEQIYRALTIWRGLPYHK
ncbi:23S rRNA (pseudouridine(1915)-N(3))-methyltransferase RlmH [bacterium]|nr:23S rRNA (pseudouridine(1915)-N(3))-methyltransferase RlmH [bacterium]